MLDGAEAAGFEWPYTGRIGADPTSAARLVSISIDQHDECFVSKEQVKAGYVLTEVACPRSGCVVAVVGVEDEFTERKREGSVCFCLL